MRDVHHIMTTIVCEISKDPDNPMITGVTDLKSYILERFYNSDGNLYIISHKDFSERITLNIYTVVGWGLIAGASNPYLKQFKHLN